MTTRTVLALPRQRRSGDPATPRTGPVRLDQRGGRLFSRLAEGDVAVVDHLDIDLETATAIVSRHPAAVVNAAISASGRAPGLGAAALVAAGVRVVDAAGPQVLASLNDGDVVTVTADGQVVLAGAPVGSGTVLDEAAVARAMQHGRAALRSQVAACGAAAPAVVDVDGHALAPGQDPGAASGRPPDLGLLLAGQGRRGRGRARTLGRHPVLVAAAGPRLAADLAVLRRRVPRSAVTVATDLAAAATTAAGRRVDVVVGDVRRVPDEVLAGRPHVVQLADSACPAGDLAESRERVEGAGVSCTIWSTSLGPAEAGVLLAGLSRAPFVVVAGHPRGLVEFADRSPRAMAAAALTRAAVGHTVVDAATLTALSRPPVSWAAGVVPAVAGIGALAVAVAVLAGWAPAVEAPWGIEPVVERLGSVVDQVRERIADPPPGEDPPATSP